MNLVSFEYIAFISFFFVVTLLFGGKVKKIVLLTASFLFVILYGNYYHAAWIYGTALYIYLAGLLLQKSRNKFVIGVLIAPVVLSLLFFKYNGFFEFENIVMPLGISFYTFRAISYLVDLSEQRSNTVSFLDTLIYLSFFPSVTAGPIQRIGDFAEQINKKQEKFDYLKYKNAAVQCALGMFQKLVFADYLSGVCNAIFSYEDSHGILLICGAILYSFQLYLDFDGYSNMAIGASKLFGIEMKKNFHTPYLAQSIIEFWNRWHISLSTWLKRYIYIPLGGNRKGVFRKYINILIVFVISGLWHGSTYVFLIWGIGHGVVNIVENIIASCLKKYKLFSNPGFIQRWFKRMVNFIVVTILWVFFRSENLPQAIAIFNNMLVFDRSSLNYLAAGITNREVIWIITILFTTFVTDLMRNKTDMIVWLSKRNVLLRWSFYILLIFVALVFGAYGPGHNAADFIYASF